MRRRDRQITDPAAIADLLSRCKVCRIAVTDRQGPYIVPLNFGYQLSGSGALTLYFHSAQTGRKLSALQACTGPVAFEMDCAHRLTAGPTACQYGYDYQSLLGTGQVRILKDPAEKAVALSLLMRAQTGRDFSFSESETRSVAVFSLTSTDYTAKQRGY